MSIRLAIGSLLALSGCWAEIGDPLHPPPMEQPPDPPPPDPPPPIDPGLVCTSTLAPGRSPIHRLTRLEYDRTIRQLTGDTVERAAVFPADPSHAGFDNVSDVQTISLLHAEKYEEAAAAVAENLWERELDRGLNKRWEAELRSEEPAPEALQQSCCGSPQFNNVVANGARGFWTAYRVFTLTELDRPADYTVTARAWLQDTETATLAVRPLQLQILFNEQPIATVALSALREAPELVVGTVHVEAAGFHRIDVQLVDATRYSDPPGQPKVWVDWIAVERASTRSATPPHFRRCELEQAGCLRSTLEQFVRRAYRRPATGEELDRLLALNDAARAAGDSEKEAIIQVLSAILLSPHFLYRVELDPDLDSTAEHPVTAHELAARLSYFLTASMPDGALSAAADDGSLLDPRVLGAHASRLLGDPVMVANLGSQWMSTRALDTISPSTEFFPNFDESLRASMGRETELFFEEVFHADRPARELVDARYTYLDDRLAAHYGLPLPGSDTHVRVELNSSQRGGVLGLGSILALNSTPARPSQVLRGKWVLSQLLCDEPEAPPFNVPPLSSSPGSTPRQQLEEHAKNPVCASCHARMDPIGFALDAYDADGSFRERDRQGTMIDVSGRFPDGTTVHGLEELRNYLAADEDLDRCLAQHLYVYGLARAPTHDDQCQAKAIAARAGGSSASFSQLIAELVKSPPFLMRQAEGVRP